MQWECYQYEVTENGIRLTGYDPSADELPEERLILPAQIDGMPVVEIGEEAFTEGGGMISSMEVPATVRCIRRGAFKLCLSLTELVLHEGLEEIEAEVFDLTPLAQVSIPDSLHTIGQPWELTAIVWGISAKNPHFFTDGICLYQTKGEEQTLLVARRPETDKDEPSAHWRSYTVAPGTTHIGEHAFAGHDTIERISLPDSLRVIGEHAFSRCIRLKQLHLPASVQTIGALALSDTFGWSDTLLGLEQITVDADNPYFSVEQDTLFAAGAHNDRIIVKYFGKRREYCIPEDVTAILPAAFRRSPIRKCTIPASVKEIGVGAFRECRDLEGFVLQETGTVLYVPRQPVYRKDEITELFFSAKRAEQLRQEHAKVELPQKWQAFAQTMVSSKVRSAHVDLDGAFVYDYRGYDVLFSTYLNIPDLCGMACCRLKYPVRLSPETANAYREFIRDHFFGILESVAVSHDIERLALLSELGFFTESNIESSVELFSARGETKLTGFLLHYKREHLGGGGFDFRL